MFIPPQVDFRKPEIGIDLFLFVVYRPPYEEYIKNTSEENGFAAQLYEIVVVQKCRPTLIRELRDQQHAPVRTCHFLYLF